MSGRDENADPRPSATGLIDSAVQLIRAELALTFLRARHGATRAVVALVATLVSAELALVTLLLTFWTPMLVEVVPWRSVSLSFGASLATTVASALVAWRAWRWALAATRPRLRAGTSSAPPEITSAPDAAPLASPAIQKN
jgi:hypothetical protein